MKMETICPPNYAAFATQKKPKKKLIPNFRHLFLDPKRAPPKHKAGALLLYDPGSEICSRKYGVKLPASVALSPPG
jgi:hypothetical protein